MNAKPVEVLIVEDNPDDLALTMMALRKGKLANEIVVARDGVEALDFLFGRAEHANRDVTQQPRVILLDLKLPRVDGHEVLRAIRENPLTRDLPVIVMTSSDQDRDVLDSYELKVNSYVVKPVSFDQFHAAVTQVGMYWLLLNQPPV